MKKVIFILIVLASCNNKAKPKLVKQDTSMMAEIRYKDGFTISAYDTSDSPIVKMDTIYTEDATVIRRYYVLKSNK